MPTYFEELLQLGVPESLAPSPFAFEDCFDEFVAGTQKTWKQDRSLTVGASECFGCQRKSWFGKVGKHKGFKRDEDYVESWGAVRRGDLIENYHVVPAIETGLKRRGMELIMCGDGQDTIIEGVHSATLDGLIINAPRDLLAYYGIPDMGANCCVLEMKSFDPRINIVEAKGIHIGQTQMQMGLIRETTEYRPEYAVVLYVNASWIDDIRIFIVPFEQSTYDAGRRRNEKTFAEDDPAMIPAEGKIDGSCAYCPFKKACEQVTAARVPPAEKPLTSKKAMAAQDADLLLELDTLVHHQQKLKSEEKRLKKEIEEANESVRQALIARNRSRAVGQGWKVSYSLQAGRKVLNREKLEEVLSGMDMSLDEFMEEGGSFEKLTVTSEWDDQSA